jgi:nicotinate phosphoribosyltransferase
VPGALLTDLYELNMAASYLRRGMTASATFSLFVRRLPAERGFLVAAGLEDSFDRLERFSFEESDLAYLRDTLGFGDTDVDAFRPLRFTGDVWAVPEGRIVFANEPLMEVTAPLPEAQLVETLLLNEITWQTTVASKAARCVIAAGGKADLVDFAFRRTQGIEAAMEVARASAMVGFVATSNVEAARRFGLVAAGTMAHSYIEAFPTEREAFEAFASDFPHRTTFLVDTYDTEGGIGTAVEVIGKLGLRENLGIRIDSGDLGALATDARRILDRAGLGEVRVFVSGGLDEYDIDGLVRAGAPIDAFGVGTRMGTSADAPYVDSVYKLVEYGGRPVLKLSAEKVTAPGAKQVFRSMDGECFTEDLIGLRDEPPPAGSRPLLEPVMQDGRRLRPRGSLVDQRARFGSDLRCLPERARAIRDPEPMVAGTSTRLTDLTDQVRRNLEVSSALRGAVRSRPA